MKVGEYCRTDKGKIGKIVHFEPRDKYPYSYDRVILDTEGHKRTTRNIIKCSEDIKDLIEENDLVRIEYYAPSYKEKITRIFVVDFKNENDIAFENSHCNLNIFDNEWSKHDIKLNPVIKGIITHEQIESMEYKVKE